MAELLDQIVTQNREGAPVALTSVCSAHPEVLRASMLLARDRNRAIAVEATSNQVNQDGGYTGMKAADFVAFVFGIADEVGLSRDLIVLGGDHLGPQAWRSENADIAMEKARILVADYVAAGFTKIHLDCSEGCAGEAAQLPDEITAARAADLAVAARDAAADPSTLRFIVGTEVPPPGGARVDEDGQITPTKADAARATLAAHEAAFAEAGVSDLWSQVVGLVVQPGVEFSPMQVHRLPMGSDPGLRDVMLEQRGLALEAHSTDYQSDETYPRLAELGFAFLKVGPALTFAWREALYGLDQLARYLDLGLVPLDQVMEQVMVDNPGYWQGHYRGDDLKLQRHFGLADRIRYYWPRPEVQAAVDALFAALQARDLPDPLVAQVFSPDVIAFADMINAPRPKALALASVQSALAPYLFDGAGGTA